MPPHSEEEQTHHARHEWNMLLEPTLMIFTSTSICHRPGDKVQRIFPSAEEFPRLGNAPPPAFICDKCVTRFSAMLNDVEGSETDGSFK